MLLARESAGVVPIDGTAKAGPINRCCWPGIAHVLRRSMEQHRQDQWEEQVLCHSRVYGSAALTDQSLHAWARQASGSGGFDLASCCCWPLLPATTRLAIHPHLQLPGTLLMLEFGDWRSCFRRNALPGQAHRIALAGEPHASMSLPQATGGVLPCRFPRQQEECLGALTSAFHSHGC